MLNAGTDLIRATRLSGVEASYGSFAVPLPGTPSVRRASQISSACASWAPVGTDNGDCGSGLQGAIGFGAGAVGVDRVWGSLGAVVGCAARIFNAFFLMELGL